MHTSAVRRVFFTTLIFGIALAILLSWAEANYPIKPDYVAVEVILGVLIVGIPTMIIRRLCNITSAAVYEAMVIVGFVGAGIPICIWQFLLYF